MFPFEKLTVYKKAKAFHKEVQQWLQKQRSIDRVTSNQLKRAALSVPLNIAEGSGRFTKPDQRNFYVVARSSVFECVAVFDILGEEGVIGEKEFRRFYEQCDELSRMLYAMIQRIV